MWNKGWNMSNFDTLLLDILYPVIILDMHSIIFIIV